MVTVRITVMIPVFLLLTSSLAGCTSNDSGQDNCKFAQPTQKQLDEDYSAIKYDDKGPNWGADLTNCDFRNADLTQEYLTGANLSGSDLSGADFTGQYLQDVDLSNTKLVGAIFTDARSAGRTSFYGANLSDADLSDMNFYNTNLSFTRLVNANLRDTYFESHSGRVSTLHGANLTGADLQGATIHDDISYANLTDANLLNAQLTWMRGTSRGGAEGVIWNNTICPSGSNSNDIGGLCPEPGIYSKNSSQVTMEIIIGDSVENATSNFTIVIEIFHDFTPLNADNFQNHVLAGSYDNVTFHRIIDDSMIQGGDFEHNNGTGGYASVWYGYCDGNWMASSADCPTTAYTVPDEANLPHYSCMVSMAKTAEENSAGSQFFIIPAWNISDSYWLYENPPVYGHHSWLDGHHSVFGEVVSGCWGLNALLEIETDGDDVPITPVTIVSATVSDD